MTAPTTTVLAPVLGEDGKCIGFVLARGHTGFEAFDRDDKSIGIFPSQPQAANAVVADKK